MIHPILFIILAAVAIAAAAGLLLSRDAVHSALYLVLNFATIAIFYLLLNAPFISMVQITVYAGAIVVLFLFVIMMLGADKLRGAADNVPGSEKFHRYIALFLGLVLAGVFGYMALQGGIGVVTQVPPIDASPQALGMTLFQYYTFPFLATGVLLLVAVIAVVVFGHVRKGGKSHA